MKYWKYFVDPKIILVIHFKIIWREEQNVHVKSPQSGTKRVGITYSDFYTTLYYFSFLFFFFFFSFDSKFSYTPLSYCIYLGAQAMSSRVSLFFYTFFLLFSVYPQESFYHFIYIYQSELTENMQNIYELDRNYLNIW